MQRFLCTMSHTSECGCVCGMYVCLSANSGDDVAHLSSAPGSTAPSHVFLLTMMTPRTCRQLHRQHGAQSCVSAYSDDAAHMSSAPGSTALSLSHDSVFTPDKAREVTASIGELKSSAVSMERLPPFTVRLTCSWRHCPRSRYV